MQFPLTERAPEDGYLFIPEPGTTIKVLYVGSAESNDAEWVYAEHVDVRGWIPKCHVVQSVPMQMRVDQQQFASTVQVCAPFSFSSTQRCKPVLFTLDAAATMFRTRTCISNATARDMLEKTRERRLFSSRCASPSVEA